MGKTPWKAGAAVNMKSLSILPLLFVVSQAFHIDDSGQNPVPVGQGGDLTLHCKTNKIWDQCVFTHEINGKSCTINHRKDENFPKEDSDCSDSSMRMGGGSNRKRCEVVIEKVKKEDAGKWTCKLKKGEHKNDERKIEVKLNEVPVSMTTGSGESEKAKYTNEP